MVKKSRLKIIITLSCTFALSIAIITGLLYIYEKNENRNDYESLITNHFRILAEEVDGSLDISVDDSERPDKKMVTGDDYSVDRQREYIYVIRTPFAESEEFEVFERAQSGTLSDEEILEVGENIYALDRLSGTYENYIFASTIVNDYLNIAFIDITETIENEHRNLLNLFLAGALIWLILTGFGIPISRILVKPLEEAIRRQSEFIRMAEHELKTPLAVMQTSLTMLGKEGVDSKYLDYAIAENDKMKNLVGEMLELSRAEQNSEVKELPDTDISTCVEGATLPFEAIAYEKGVIFETGIQPGVIRRADAAQIDRLVGILVDNAIKHTDKGKKVFIGLNSRELEVRNQGEPIPAEERAKIFEPFYRIDKARNRDEGRYGLGLTIAAQIVKMHNATINVDYEDGYTVFKVIFS